MKQITKLAAFAAFGLAAFNAQGQFFEKVNFVGALDSDPSKDWTAGWANFNPKSTTYPAVNDTTTLNGIDGGMNGKKELSADLTLDASKVYLLKGIIVVPSGRTLTVPAGTVIRGRADVNATPKNYACIVVERGGKINVNGTASNPVVMTSWRSSGREGGDWGGLAICGRARNNQGADVQIEGFNNVAFDPNLAKFGGTDDNDNSGSITYCRIEFAGLAFEPNKELNSLTLGSVGRGTTLHHVQCSYGNDDAFEWFGGNVNGKYLIAYRTVDDDWDCDFGWSGAVQFGISVKDTNYYDLTWNATSGGSTSESWECDNDAGGSGKTPYTSPVFSNITSIGPVQIGGRWSDGSSTVRGAFRRGARIRRNSRVTIVNSIIMGYRNAVMFDGDSVLVASGVTTASFPNNATSMIFRNNIIMGTAAGAPAGSANNGLVEVASGNASFLAGFDTWIKDATNANRIDPVAFTAGTLLVDPQNSTTPNFRPVAMSPALSGANFDYNRIQAFGVVNGYKTLETVTNVMSYPNPARDKFSVQFDNMLPFSGNITLIDMQGRVVRNLGTRQFAAGYQSIEIGLEGLSNGIYTVNIHTEAGKISQRVMVSK
jgi:hypothetical protein